MMLTEVAVVGDVEVDLIVVGAIGIARQERRRTIRNGHCRKVVNSEHHVVAIAGTRRGVKVRTRSVAVVEGIDGIVRTVLVGLAVVDALRIGEAGGESLQWLPESEVEVKAAAERSVVVHRLAVVTILLERVERIVLVAVHRRIGGTIRCDRFAIDLLGNIIRMGEQQVVVLLAACATDLHERGILGSIVTADSKVGPYPVAELDIDACTIVPAAVVELAKVTVLVEVTDAGEIGSTLGSAADIDRMLLGECRTPILVEQVITEALHGCKFIRLEKVGQTIERRILWVGGLHGIPQTTIVVGRKHLRTSHFVGNTHRARVADLRSTLLTLLGGNKDDTIGSTRTIDSSCGVLQYGD